MIRYEDINRLNELRQALLNTSSQANVQEGLRPATALSAAQAKESLARHAPVGKREPDYTIPGYGGSIRAKVSHGRPSIRLFGMTLAEGWAEPTINDIDDGQEFVITSIAPHMRFLVQGTPAHSIPKQTPGPMSFWSFRENAPFISHWFLAFAANHPGMAKSNFIQVALASGLEQTIGQNLLSGLKRVARPITDFFNR